MKEFEEDELYDLLEELHPIKDSKGKNLIINCPVCGERECSISIDSPYKWGCFRLKNCGERGNIWKILKILGKLNDIINSNSNSYDYIDINNLLGEKKSNEDVNLNVDLEELPNISKPFGWTQILKNDEYLDARGFKSYKYCEVGKTTLDPILKNNYIIFLVRENGNIKGYVARHIWSKDKIEQYNLNYYKTHGKKNRIKRYSNSEGTDFSKLLYGLDEIDENNIKTVCLVEGIFDKLAIDHKLMLNSNRFMYTCATFKCFVSDTQILKLKMKGVTDIILFYDPDVINQIKKNIEKLINYFNVRVIISSYKKDPDEMDQFELIETFEKNLYNPNYVLSNFLQVKQLK